MSEWETYCDESYYHLWRVRRKNERNFDDGFHLQNGNEAKSLVAMLNNMESELAAAREELDDWNNAALHVNADHPDEVHCGCVAILRKQLKDATEQRDRLAEALHKLAEIFGATDKSSELTGKSSELAAEAMTAAVKRTLI